MPSSVVMAAAPSSARVQQSLQPSSCRTCRLGLFGIEHLSIDATGDVRWRGVIVEQLQPPSWGEIRWQKWMRAEAFYLESVCREIEEAGIRPSLASVCGW